MTAPLPRASDNGRFRLGFLTSAAVKVTLFHASAANRAPTMATPTKVIVPMNQVGLSGGYGCWAPSEALRQKSVKFAERAAAVEKKTPRRARPAKAAAFATVNMFCTTFPKPSPRVFIQVRNTIEAMARRF